MTATPLRRDVHWVPAEDALLRELAEAGQPAAEIAQQLSRSTAAIRNRAVRLKIALAKVRNL